jgi:hypothetical protein
LRLTAMNAEAVALTQGTTGSVGAEQPVLVTSRSATVTRAWNVVVAFFPVLRNTTL